MSPDTHDAFIPGSLKAINQRACLWCDWAVIHAEFHLRPGRCGKRRKKTAAAVRRIAIRNALESKHPSFHCPGDFTGCCFYHHVHKQFSFCGKIHLLEVKALQASLPSHLASCGLSQESGICPEFF